MSKITRRAVLAGVPAIAASVPVAAAPTVPSMDLRPSDPAMAAAWAELFPRLVEVQAKDTSGLTLDQDRLVAAEIDLAWDALRIFAAQLRTSPVRTLGDVVLRAAVARYWAFENADGTVCMPDEWDNSSDNSSERASAHLVEAVLKLAGLPTDQPWEVALARTAHPAGGAHA